MNAAQAASLARFIKKLPRRAGATTVRDLSNGAVLFQADVPATNVPGSFARYEKEVGADGLATSYIKTTYGPDGAIVSVKKKFP